VLRGNELLNCRTRGYTIKSNGIRFFIFSKAGEQSTKETGGRRDGGERENETNVFAVAFWSLEGREHMC
jgi:hypothetical protein